VDATNFGTHSLPSILRGIKMPMTVVGTVKFDSETGILGEYSLKDVDGHDALSRILERYDGKKIRMRVSIQEVIG